MESESVLIGTKPLHSYILACFTKFNDNALCNKVILKARGRTISRCVDVAEIITKRYFKDQVDISDIRISTIIINNNKISTMEIDLSKS